MSFDYDIIVVGAGHAGVEASLASSRMGLSTAVVTTNLDRIAYMSCNPSIGGLAKGHMVRELDTMGGQMGLAADATCIQFKRLNSRKGPAVRGTRVQNDKDLYSKYMTESLLSQPNLKLLQAEVKALLLNGERCEGVILEDGSYIRSRSTVITTGTFMNAVMHIGLEQTPGGRVGDKASIGLSDQLAEFGFKVRRLKTGTPARLHRDSIDWSKTTAQFGDEKFYPFSFKSENKPRLPQIACYLSRTTQQTHQIIRDNLKQSPLYCGIIEGVGPRYCPSIEDKIVRFADKESHQTFLEPEGLNTESIYLQGISTSLPVSVQYEFLKTIPGLENVKVIRPGYAVEYDFIEPTQIWHRLEARTIKGLFLAGQINGTSGYEEAAVQGFVAGVNAAHSVLERDEFVLRRDEAYIGVLIDDLVTKGTQEPYRMFTSRAEHRLILREDNSIDRLSHYGVQLGLISGQDAEEIFRLKEGRASFLSRLKSVKIYPNASTQEKLRGIGSPELLKSVSAEELLRRSEICATDLEQFDVEIHPDPRVNEAVEIEVKYSGYVKRQLELIAQQKRFEDTLLPEDLEYKAIKGLRTEELEKLMRIRPRTLGQAQRISGVNPSAIQSILIYLKTQHPNTKQGSKSEHPGSFRSTDSSLET